MPNELISVIPHTGTLPIQRFSDTEGFDLHPGYSRQESWREPSRLGDEVKIGSIAVDADSRFELATRVTTEGIWDLDCETGKIFASGKLREMLQLPDSAELSPTSFWTTRIYHRDWWRTLKNWATKRRSGEERFEAEFRCADVAGNWHWIRIRALAQSSPCGDLLRIVGTAIDITALRQTDPLTGLHNRLSLLEHLQWRIERADRERRNFALYFLDLDSFKIINDTLGHASGDALIIEVAKRLSQTLPPSSASIAARIGGDEFVVMVDDLAAEVDAMMFGEFLRHILNAPHHLSQVVSSTASIGVSFGSPDRLLSVEQMLEEADIAMYHAKTHGKASCVLYSPSMRQEIEEKTKAKQELHQAVLREQFELHYQPIVDVSSMELVGVEALLRWRHPEKGLIAPGEFISLAEDTGLIVQIGEWVFDESVVTLSGWIDRELVNPAFKYAVNVSVRQLQKAELMPNLLRRCEASNLQPSRLRLEITESALMQNLPVVTETLQAASDAGIGLDLDDFGTGFSSLSYLQDFSFQCMKVDCSFTKRIATDTKSRTLVSTIVGMAHSLGMDIIAEGVETKEQADILKAIGCEHSQGFYYSKPLPKSEFELRWLQTHQGHTRSVFPN